MKLIPVMAALESFKSSFLCTSRHMGAIQLTPSVVRTCLERHGDVQALVLQRTVHAQNFARHFFLLKAFNKIVPENKHVYIHVCQFCVLCQYAFRVVTCVAEVGDMWQLTRRIEAKSKISKHFVDIRKHTTQPFGWIYLMCGGQAANKNSNPRSIAATEIRSIFPGNFCNSGFNLHLRLCGRQVQRTVCRKCCVELQSNSFKRAKGQAKCVYTMLPDMCHCTFGETSPSSTFFGHKFPSMCGSLLPI